MASKKPISLYRIKVIIIIIMSVFKTEFSSSFEKLKDSITVKFSDINAQLDEIEKIIKNQ